MFAQTLAIIRNTFFESIRQPIMLVLLVIATFAIIASNVLATHTMDDDHKMMVDMGLATVFLCGTLAAAFIATNVVSREIENRTVLTVISKPVARPLFVLGKFLGVAGAIFLAAAYMSLAFLMVELHGTLQTLRDPYHAPVILFGLGSLLIGGIVALWCNYFYNQSFVSTALCVTTPLVAIAYLLSLMFNHAFEPQWIGKDFKPQIWLSLGPLVMALMVLTAIAVAVSTRLGQVMTIAVTMGVFLLGMMSDWIFGRQINSFRNLWLDRAGAAGLLRMEDMTRTVHLVDGSIEHFPEQVRNATVPLTSLATSREQFEHAATWIGYAIVPNFQVFWLSDALTQNHRIPGAYVGMTIVYGLLLIIAALGLATILFQTREVG